MIYFAHVCIVNVEFNNARPNSKQFVWGSIMLAAIIICTFVPSMRGSSNKNTLPAATTAQRKAIIVSTYRTNGWLQMGLP